MNLALYLAGEIEFQEYRARQEAARGREASGVVTEPPAREQKGPSHGTSSAIRGIHVQSNSR